VGGGGGGGGGGGSGGGGSGGGGGGGGGGFGDHGWNDLQLTDDTNNNKQSSEWCPFCWDRFGFHCSSSRIINSLDVVAGVRGVLELARLVPLFWVFRANNAKEE
jgi:hypothetical protein